jgi:hypothetical protein
MWLLCLFSTLLLVRLFSLASLFASWVTTPTTRMHARLMVIMGQTGLSVAPSSALVRGTATVSDAAVTADSGVGLTAVELTGTGRADSHLVEPFHAGLHHVESCRVAVVRRASRAVRPLVALAAGAKFSILGSGSATAGRMFQWARVLPGQQQQNPVNQ